MKRIGTMVSMLVLAGSLAGSAMAEDGILLKEPFTPDSYCHMKFTAINESTLFASDPRLKDASSGDVIDYYGSCDESPTGADQVAAQKRELTRHHWDLDES